MTVSDLLGPWRPNPVSERIVLPQAAMDRLLLQQKLSQCKAENERLSAISSSWQRGQNSTLTLGTPVSVAAIGAVALIVGYLLMRLDGDE